jgi:hypothetical protein
MTKGQRGINKKHGERAVLKKKKKSSDRIKNSNPRQKRNVREFKLLTRFLKRKQRVYGRKKFSDCQKNTPLFSWK